MWWLLLLLLAGCEAQEQIDVQGERIEFQKEAIAVLEVVENTTINETMTNATEKTTPQPNPTPNNTAENIALTGNFVRFYISTKNGLETHALSEGMNGTYEGNQVEAVFVGSNNGIGRTLLRVNGDLTRPLEEKEGSIIGGTYVFIMEILYKN